LNTKFLQLLKPAPGHGDDAERWLDFTDYDGAVLAVTPTITSARAPNMMAELPAGERRALLPTAKRGMSLMSCSR
jgi:hypothetical protein